ncbi:MAG TPA: glucose 1-dehydrogenase [Gammaproteobacteria bacterium]|nr:glucose 1-dehydrogenase [Gammaproteobacteria bacterium]
MGRLAGKIAVITGGNSGMGLETARRFVAEGANVVITGRRRKELDEAVKSMGKNVTGIQGDVSNLKDLDRLYAGVKETHGHIDILFANAGLGQVVPLDLVSEKVFDLHFDVNVKGLFFTVQKALPLMRDGGSIILNASIAARKGMGGMSVYSATKAAVRSFARTWTMDLKDRKIRVNTLSPGPIDTPIFGKMGLTEEQTREFGEHVLEQVPMGRMGTSDEVARAVVFLASDDSSYITGIDLCVDGGMAQI